MRTKISGHPQEALGAGPAQRISGIYLNGTAPAASELSRMVRGGNGGVFLDRDGVLSIIDRQIDAALRKEFNANRDPKRGIEYNFEVELVHKLFGISPKYNDGSTPILALMALNIEAQATPGCSANDLLRDAVKSPDSVDRLDKLIAKHTESEHEFVMENMYWWRKPGGFMWSREAEQYIRPYKRNMQAHGDETSSRDAVIALLEAGFPVAMITNAPTRGLRTAGFSRKDLKRKVDSQAASMDQLMHEEGRMLVLTRRELGENMKPHPLGLEAAARTLGVSLDHSIVAGDTWSDMKLAENGGAVPILLESGMGQSHHLKREFPGLQVFPDLILSVFNGL